MNGPYLKGRVKRYAKGSLQSASYVQVLLPGTYAKFSEYSIGDTTMNIIFHVKHTTHVENKEAVWGRDFEREVPFCEKMLSFNAVAD